MTHIGVGTKFIALTSDVLFSRANFSCIVRTLVWVNLLPLYKIPDDLGLALNSSCLLVSSICIFDQLIQKGLNLL
nr:hypothetical protein CFP56_33068 [Quercus suber]